MIYRPTDDYYCQFITINPYSGVSQNADTLPVAIATRNGTDDSSFSLTVSNIDTGRYLVTGVIPGSYIAGDRIQVSVTATVEGVQAKMIIDDFMVDTKYMHQISTDVNQISTDVNQISIDVNQISIDVNQIYADMAKEITLNTKASQATVDAIKIKTDNLNFSGTDVKATLDGETVVVGSNQDKVGYSISSSSEDSLVSKVWLYSNRTLTSFGSLISDIWEHSNRTLTSFGLLVSDIVSSVWTYSDRTLTSFGSLISDIATSVWSFAVRKLTSRNISNGEDIASEQVMTNLLSGNLLPGILQNKITVTKGVISIIRGDVSTLTFNLGSSWNLTGKKMYVCIKKSKTDDNSLAIVNRECSIIDAMNGIGEITLTSNETSQVGTYFGEVEVRDIDDTNPQTARQFVLRIEQDIRQ